MFSRKKAQNAQKLNNHFCAFVPVCGYFQAQLREQRSGSFPGNRIGVCKHGAACRAGTARKFNDSKSN
jgi:hypothetical protein